MDYDNPEWYHRLNDIELLRKFPDDWDGKGAKRPDPILIDSSKEFIEIIRERFIPPQLISPEAKGTILFLWAVGYSINARIRQPRIVRWELGKMRWTEKW